MWNYSLPVVIAVATEASIIDPQTYVPVCQCVRSTSGTKLHRR